MIDFINYVFSRKTGLFVAIGLAFLVSFAFNSYKSHTYYYDIGLYVDPIVIYNDEGIPKEEIFGYQSIFLTKAFYAEHNRTRIQKSFPLITKKDGDTIRIVDDKYDDTYSYGKKLMESIYKESIVNINYFHDAGVIYKTESEKVRLNKILSSNYNNSDIFSYVISPVRQTGIDNIKIYILFLVLSVGIYLSYIFLKFAEKQSR
tara:strand:+ start:1062 stop:1670 length:609 start_codon:yes stop_codon:yes gene_type:complete